MNTKDEQKRQKLPSNQPQNGWFESASRAVADTVFDSALRAIKQPRRIVQICASKHGVYALASDGTIWVGSPVSETWHQLPNLPQE